MTNAKKLPAAKAKVPAPGIAEVLDGIRTIAECVRDIEKERTQQTRLREEARVEVSRIEAMRGVLLDYLERSFDERRENFRMLFERLDGAIERNDVPLTAAVLDSVVKLADSSPFKALQDAASTRAVLKEKGKEWMF